ncbi:Shedu anti-phage system protein SduA domain-containing protein [Frankia sp. QA3]|uniref:Shedu anti-phage system protein SduA domain-containing protein n=1 Tax=Frankia sp. QA3 TaxID=710111 RepID=UPI000269BAD9|nr:Shedu anti-phage system protein SduA domain-containing protein [Frankia sp. QA3]EIV91060.1 hypothetical protein FraQA3DRAFT_0484 [Frankia sp. QA3]
MSRYSVDLKKGTLLISWPTGFGETTRTIASAPGGAQGRDLLHLAETLTFLSATLWRRYTQPTEEDVDSRSGAEGRRDEDETATIVLGAMERPNLPSGGMIVQSYVFLEEAAHRVGRALYKIGSAKFTQYIVADVRAEFESITQAEHGDLSGRAKQAVALTRSHASPEQIAAAEAILRDNPYGDDRLFTEVDPTAAAVAAARWLHAAATVTAKVWGGEPYLVVMEADNIEAIADVTPTLVLRRIAHGEKPEEVVLDLIAGALELASGIVPDPTTIANAAQDHANDFARLYGFEPTENGSNEDHGPVTRYLTPLDPKRPALDLLEDLISGIYGCWLLFREYTIDYDSIPEDEPTEEWNEATDKALRKKFIQRVRRSAAKDPVESLSATELGQKLAGRDDFSAVMSGISSTPAGLSAVEAAVIQRRREIVARLHTMVMSYKTTESALQREIGRHHWLFGGQYIGIAELRSMVPLDQYDIPLICADGSLHIVELKQPSAKIIKKYRNHYIATSEVHEAVSQCENYLRSLDEWATSLRTHYRDEKELDYDLRRVRATVVIGHPRLASEIAKKEKVDQTLRTYNSHLSRIQVVTYLDLLDAAERALKFEAETPK